MAKEPPQAKSAADQPTLPTPPSGTEPKTATLQVEPAEKIGGTIGPFKLLDELGEGGMGTVYLAEQERPVRRRVALKVIKPGLDTAQVIARFEAERQALALMDHPNIARVVDAGATTSGRPFFVMELVQGVPITSYCDSHRLTLRQRLELFLPICRAVQHAHQKGIIHRDLKPSNILVTLRDDQPVPKIIDFGIAKATTQRLTERTLYTQYGQLVGTPDYMSPEQAGMGGIDVDTRSDVYSLGAILYELLCGETPLGHRQLRQLDFVSMINTIHETEPPPPSRRAMELGENAAEIARRRDTEPAKFAQNLRGEIDWIVSKAIEKERTRRYESPSALAADIERHLNNQPLEASPPSAIYRLQKFVRRNRAGLAAAATIATVLLVGIIVSAWQAYRATQAEHEMGIEREAAIQAKGQAEKLLIDVDAARKLAEGQKKLAEDRGTQLAAALTKANDAAKKESDARAEIERRLREADATRLAMNSQESRARYPQRALLLAAEAVEATRRKEEPIRAVAHQALRTALDNIGGRPMAGHEGVINFMAATPNGRWLFTSDYQDIRRWDLAAGDPVQSSTLVGKPGISQLASAISPDGKWLATLSRDASPQKISLWDLQADALQVPASEFDTGRRDLNEVQFSTDAQWLIGRSWNSAWLWSLDPAKADAAPIELSASSTQINSVAVAPGGRCAITRNHSGSPSLWNLTTEGAKPVPRQLVDSKNSWVNGSELSPDGRWLVAIVRDQRGKATITVWDLSAEDPFASPREVPSDRRNWFTAVVHFSASGQFLAVAANDQIALWDPLAEKWDVPKLTLSLGDTAPVGETGVALLGISQTKRATVSRTTTIAADSPTGAPYIPQAEFSRPDVHEVVRQVITDRYGRALLAIDQTGSIHAWDLGAKDPNRSRVVVGRHAGGAVDAELSPGGRWLVTSRQGEPPRLWDLWRQNTRASGLELRGHDSASYRTSDVAFGGGIVPPPSAADQVVQLPFFDFSRQIRASLGIGERWLITRGPDATPRLWDLAAEDPGRAGVEAGTFRVTGRDVAIRDDGKWVAWQEPSQVQVIDPDKSEHVVATFDVRTGSFSGGWSGADRSLSRDGRWLALRTGERIGIYDLASEQFAAQQAASSEATQTASKVQSADEKKPAVWQPAVAGGQWLQRLLLPQAGRPEMVAPLAHEAHSVVAIGETSHLDAIVISSTGRWLLTEDDNRWRLWDLQDNKSAATAIDIGANLIHASFSPSDRWLVTYKQVIAQVNSANRLEITLWDLAAAPLRKSSKMHELTGSYSIGRNVLAFSGNNKWLASNTGGVRIWPIADDGTLGEPETLATQQYGGEQAIALSADGRLVAAAENQAVRLWDRSVTNPTLRVRELHGHEQSVVRVAFSPDGAWLVSTSQDGDVRLWDLRDEQLQDAMIALKVDNERQSYLDIQNLHFSADGRWLAAGTNSGVYFWRLDPTSLLDEARRLAGRDLNPDELARYRLNTPDRQHNQLLRQAELVTARLERTPQDIALLQRRTDLYAFAGEFNAAIDDLRLIARLQPDDHWPVYCLLTLLAKTNQADEYRRVAEAMATRFHDPPPANYEILERVAKASLFWADSGADWKKIAPLADRALEKSVATQHWVVPWAQIAKAMAEYRLGHYAQAIEWADKGLGPLDAPIVHSVAVPGNFVKAVAHAQMGQLEEAQAALAKAKKVQADVPTPLQEWTGWNDWYMCDIMLREADALLLEKSPPATALAPKTE